MVIKTSVMRPSYPGNNLEAGCFSFSIHIHVEACATSTTEWNFYNY